MSRRALVLSLAGLQAVTVLAGGVAAVALASPAPAAPAAVSAEREVRLHPTAHALRVVPAKAVAKPRPKPKPAARPRPVVHHRHRAVPQTRPAVRHHRAPALTPEQRMMRAVADLVGYHAGDASWTISSRYGHWGMAELYSGAIYISPDVPSNRMYDVVAHEWSHVLSVKAYDGDVPSAMAAMNAYFGGSGLDGSERAADCMARVLGADWTHYTSCSSSRWRDGARRLLARHRL